jgi:putative ABC transport system permease protein
VAVISTTKSIIRKRKNTEGYMIKDYFRIAYRSARKRKVRSWLTMIGIFIGIAAVVALISLSSGLKTAISQQFVQLGSDKLIVQAAGGGFGPPGTAVPDPLIIKDKEAIAKVNGVDVVVGRLIRIVQLEFGDEVLYTFAVTMPKDKVEKELVMEANNYKIELGKFFDKDEASEVVVGNNFAKDFFDKEIQLRDRIKVQGETFKVVGILKKSGNPQQDSTLVLPEGSLRRVLGIEDEYDVVPLRVEAGEDIQLVSENIKKEMRKRRDVEKGQEDFVIETPEQIISTLNNILLVIQGILVGIASISLFVGGIGIMNTMYTAVLERTKEIGIMKAIGAKNKSIMILFLIESGFLGLFGGLIGVTIGLSIAKLVEFIAFKQLGSVLIQAEITFGLLFGALSFAFITGALSGAFPARQAAKLKPVEALRK